MMERVAKFEKVSFEKFVTSLDKEYDHEEVAELLYDAYNDIELPKRATTGSAGYDFYAPYKFYIGPGETILFPTGIRCKIKEGWVLQLFPRSGLGFKYGLQLRNTVGIIDSDYYNADNEGHIMAKLVNTGEDSIIIEVGQAFMQGILVPYGITEDDEADGVRTGGFGSTDSLQAKENSI
jgi:dUTP pyrophosphatase